MDVHVRARPERGSGEASGGMLTPHLLWVAFKCVINVCVCACVSFCVCTGTQNFVLCRHVLHGCVT